jgi:D-amino-acid dehydrogenase
LSGLRVVVLGAGVIGVTTAWRLAREGYEVVVVESEGAVGQGASSANAGMIAPGHAYPWASPAAPWSLVRSLLGDSSKLRVKEPLRGELVQWGAAFLRECTPRRTRRNLLRALRLCRHSEQLLHRWAEGEAIDYCAERGGALYLHRSLGQLHAAYRHSAIFREQGREQLMLHRDEARRREPALAHLPADQFAGAIFDPADSSGDAARFTAELARRCEGQGVTFLLGQRVMGLRAAGGAVTAALLQDGSVEGDVYVLALGAHTARVARTVGERLAIHPVKGYTATFPVPEGATAPRLPGVDEAQLVAWSRQGAKLRMSCGAEFAGFTRECHAADVEPILSFGRLAFPEAADYDAGVFRAGLRPVTPDGLPIIRRGKQVNLFINAGHGHMGWTMACGSAQIACDLIADRPPLIQL